MIFRATCIRSAAIVAAVLSFGAWAALPLSWERVNRWIERSFPEVPRVTTAELVRELEASPELLLLDVRTEEEFAVSHLRGARRVEPGSGAAVLAGVGKDREIVTYCSVGWRSAKFAEALRENGYRRVRNLQGSIFQWANEGRPVVRDGLEVSKVHPYDAKWGAMLDARLHSRR